MGFLRIIKAVATGGLSEAGGTTGRVATAIATGGASEITPKLNDLHNKALEVIADGLHIDLDKAGFLDPRRPGSIITETAQGVRDLTLSVINDGINHQEELMRGTWEALNGNPSRLLSASVLRPLDMVAGNAMLAARTHISGVQMALGWEKPSRGLSSEEQRQLEMVFGDSIDYSQVRIKEGWAGVGSLNDKDRPFTSGNTIYMKLDKNDPEFAKTLFHEMVHVWQFQHGGASYQSASLRAQTGKGDAYEWRDAVAQGKQWSQLNPEQQAALIEDGWFSGVIGDPTRTRGLPGYEYINADLAAYIRKAWEEMKAGRGAP